MTGHASFARGGWVRTPLAALPVIGSADLAQPAQSLTVAETLIASKVLDVVLSAPLPGVSKMPNAMSISHRIRAMREKHSAALDAADRAVSTRLDEIGRRGEAALDRLNAKLAADVAEHEAEVRVLEDEVNQLSNGGPPLDGSDASSAGSAG